MFNEIAPVISLFLTIPTILFSIAVLAIWSKHGIESLKIVKMPMDWLIIGVCISFLGIVLDNLFWTMILSVRYYSNDLHLDVIQMALYYNVFVRQLFGICAAYCHLKSYTEMKKNKGLNKKLWLSSSIIGILYVVVLSLLKKSQV